MALLNMLKAPLTLGEPVPQPGYFHYGRMKENEQVTLRYECPVSVAGYTATYHYPVTGTLHYNRPIKPKIRVMLHNDWYATPVGPTAPDPEDVLASLLLDALAGTNTFEEFCSDFGYDEDSRKAEKIWHQCQISLGAMHRAFGADLHKALEIASER